MPSPTRVLACCQEPLKLGAFSGFGSISGVNSCDRTASHLLGMQRAIGLMQQEEAVSGEYNMTIVMRWDVVWHQPFALRGLDISRGGVVLPTYCTSSDPRSGIVTQPSADMLASEVRSVLEPLLQRNADKRRRTPLEPFRDVEDELASHGRIASGVRG